MANSGDLAVENQEYDKIRILNFGEKVKFTLYTYRTVEGMELYSDKDFGEIPNKRFLVVKVINQLGLDVNEMDIEKLKRLIGMIGTEISRYTDAN